MERRAVPFGKRQPVTSQPLLVWCDQPAIAGMVPSQPLLVWCDQPAIAGMVTSQPLLVWQRMFRTNISEASWSRRQKSPGPANSELPTDRDRTVTTRMRPRLKSFDKTGSSSCGPPCPGPRPHLGSGCQLVWQHVKVDAGRRAYALRRAARSPLSRSRRPLHSPPPPRGGGCCSPRLASARVPALVIRAGPLTCIYPSSAVSALLSASRAWPIAAGGTIG